MKHNPEIFRAYDIRGIADTDFDEEFAYNLGLAYAQKLPLKARVSVGFDCRTTSLSYATALENGLKEGGLRVVRLGLCPTPLLYFSVFQDNLDGGIMITGSHNPKEYNGFKICLGKTTLFGKDIQDLKDVIENKKFRKNRGSIRERGVPIIESYIEHLHERFPLLSLSDHRNLKVVVDAGNGTGGTVAPSLLASLGFNVFELFCNVDGNFPNHHPDPTVAENLYPLIQTVKDEGADVGIAYDGDADRIGVVSDQGKIIWGDMLLTLFAKEIYRQKKKVSVIAEVKCSDVLFEEVKKLGGKIIMWKTGHSYIKDKLKKEKADVAGEMSGHIFFQDRYYGYDDAIYASCRLLEILTYSGKKLSELMKEIPRYFATPEIRVPCDDKNKFKVVEKLKTHFSQKYPLISIDGIRIQFGDGWGLVRPSNTQPVLVLRFEAKSEKRLEEIQSEVETALSQCSSQ